MSSFSTLIEIFVFCFLSRLFLFCVFFFISRSSSLHWLLFSYSCNFYFLFCPVFIFILFPFCLYSVIIILSFPFLLLPSRSFSYRHSFFFFYTVLSIPFYFSLTFWPQCFSSNFSTHISLYTIFSCLKHFSLLLVLFSLCLCTFFPLFTQASFPSFYFSSAIPFRSCPIFRWASYTSIWYVPIK